MRYLIFTAIFLMIIISLSPNGAVCCAQQTQNDASGYTPSRLFTSIPFDRDGKLAKGKFLVAARKLIDPNFRQTVVLLFDYHQNGAMGVIINRPVEMKLSELFTDIKELQKRTDTVFSGGPVMRNQLLMLVRTAARPEGSLRVLQDVYVASQIELMGQMIKNEKKGDRFRVYAGYAGWGRGQLDQEIKRGK